MLGITGDGAMVKSHSLIGGSLQQQAIDRSVQNLAVSQRGAAFADGEVARIAMLEHTAIPHTPLGGTDHAHRVISIQDCRMIVKIA